MASRRKIFGEIAIDLGFLTAEKIEKCAEIQRTTFKFKPIGQIAVESGFLEPHEIEECIQIQINETPNLPIGQIAINEGFLTPEQIETCAREQQQSVNFQTIGQICMNEGYLIQEQVDMILGCQSERTEEGPVIHEERKNLIAVDDSPTIRNFIKLSLASDYNVTVVPDAKEALAVIRNPQTPTFDLVILDIKLPDQNGFELAKIVRQVPGYKEKPLLFLTMHSGQNLMDKVKEVGGQGLIHKSEIKTIQALKDVVKTHLKA